ncbi:hypothetical protein QEN19_003726 [Hanseniaspora menglaensis]
MNQVGLSNTFSTLTEFHLPFIATSIIGNVCRLSILKLNNLYSSSYTTNGTILYVNFTACIFMGILQTIKFEDSNIQTCLTTGYCGTFSSFSTYIWELFIHTVLRADEYPNRGYSICEFLIGNIIELSVSISGLKFGINMGLILKQRFNFGTRKIGAVIKATLLFLSIPLLILMLVLAIVYRNKFNSYWCLSSLFAVFGTYGRFYLSKINSKPLSQKWHFPLGTFMTNFIASTVLSIFFILLQRYSSDAIKKLVIYSLIEGLTASLSTMSTFMNEMNNLSFVKSSVYFVITVFSSYSMFIIILGSYKWSRGLDHLE